MSLSSADSRVEVAESAAIVGELWLGVGVRLAAGSVVRSHDAAVRLGHHARIGAHSTVWGNGRHPTSVGQSTVLGAGVTVLGARIGDLCQLGTGCVLLPGASLGDGCVLADGTLVPAGMAVPAGTVVSGRSPHAMRSATGAADASRPSQLTDLPLHRRVGRPVRVPVAVPPIDGHDAVRSDADAVQVAGDVELGAGCALGIAARLVAGDGGQIRLGSGVQALEHAVLRADGDEDLVIQDGAVIGPGVRIDGARIGARSVVEPGVVVETGVHLGPGTLVRAGALVPAGATFGPLAIVDGRPARRIGTLHSGPSRPPWLLPATG
jgi:carbonic anhydrase/acetyltransferase-like protein (isoleucine patch superfamily)